MARQKKKRNKQYRGADSSLTAPSITKITAVKRNKTQLWWHERKRFLKPVLIAVGVIILLIVLITQIVRIATGG